MWLAQFTRLVKETLLILGDKYYSEAAVELLIRTAITESKLHLIYQVGGGPARGFFQVEPNTATSIYIHHILKRPALLERVNMIVGEGWHKNIDYKLTTDIALGIILARLKYYPDPEPIPQTLSGQAIYWKRIYNTPEGKGTVEKFIHDNLNFKG
jgi:hypothetical protein